MFEQEAGQLLDRIAGVVRLNLPDGVTSEYFEGFLGRTRPALVTGFAALLAKRAARTAIDAGDGTAVPPPRSSSRRGPAMPDLHTPPETWTAGQRTLVNLDAMRLAASKTPAELTDHDRLLLRGYSGWGGLSIAKVKDQFPIGMEPEERGLIHEFYTPSVLTDEVARVVAPLVSSLPTTVGGRVLSLEPSAGIGRFLHSFDRLAFAPLQWLTVEYSAISSRFLQATRADLSVFVGSFEQWVADNEETYSGKLGLVVSNPPYGARSVAKTLDPDRRYRERRASAYFLRRGLDMLDRNGLGVYLIPSGFLTGTGAEAHALRETVLRRHHLSAAYRLPSSLFAGAMLVTDLLFFRSRGGVAAQLPADDVPIAAGKYYELHPTHILGREVGKEADTKPKARFGYQVEGAFTRLPDLVERIVCHACTLTTPEAAPRRKGGKRSSGLARGENAQSGHAALSEPMRDAVALGLRVDGYLARVSSADESTIGLWRELHAALLAYRAASGNPWHNTELLALQRAGDVGAARLLQAFERGSGDLISGLREPPTVRSEFNGSVGDIVGQAEHLYRTKPDLTVDDVLEFHERLGGASVSRDAIADALLAGGWARDSNGAPQDGRGPWRWMPARDYYSGALWPRYDRAAALAAGGDSIARVQAQKLLDAIRPAVFEDILEPSPQAGWMPLQAIEGWMNTALNEHYHSRVRLTYDKGLVQLAGVAYNETNDATVSPDVIDCIGWINHDMSLFRPKKRPDKDIDEVRAELAKTWRASFAGWVAGSAEFRDAVTHAYNRATRGFVAPAFSQEPIPLARWRSPRPARPWQNAAARRLLTHRGGLCALDVGLGKTDSGLLLLAGARQDGWAKRPVIIVPNSIVWKWVNDVARALPDYRVVVIGSRLVTLKHGKRAGITTSEIDTPEQRAEKWTRFQAGQYDVAIVTYSALGRTRVNETEVRAYAEATAAIQREVRLRQRNLEKKSAKTLSEREEAILKEGVGAWIAERLELPESQRYDPGIAWDDLGIDLVIVDEGHNYKNLYSAGAREGGIPKFMGSQGEGSDRAWQLDFRLHAVRKRTGGSGVVILTATPAKNSPLEFYTMIQYIDHDAWKRVGINDPEQFIDTFLRIELQWVPSPKLDVELRSAVTGFKNLDLLRSVIERYGEFRTADEVGLPLPEPKIDFVKVPMNGTQDRKYVDLIAQITDALDDPSNPANRGIVLGALQRMALVSVHPALDEGFTWRTALEADVDKHSPKLDACAQRVLANKTCGHIIFCDNVAAHRWMGAVLAEAGLDPARIAYLNANAAPAPADRQRTADDFNGDMEAKRPPKYDVIICNQVAYEGVDLQTRTCAIHHLDFPWEPATLQQRNGRGVRQGNTLGVIGIFYYFSERSSDGIRFNMIGKKRGWLIEVLKSQARDTNNPMAQQNMGTEEVLLLISRDPEETAARLELVRQKAAAEARARVAENTVNTLRAANARFQQARSAKDPAAAIRWRTEAEARLAEVMGVDTQAWPWAAIAAVARDQRIFTPTSQGPPLHEGLRLSAQASPEDLRRYFEFGRINVAGDAIGMREVGEVRWMPTGIAGLTMLNQVVPADVGAADWPADDAERTADQLTAMTSALRRGTDWQRNYGWGLASDRWVTEAWNRWGAAITAAFADTPSWASQHQHVPAFVRGQIMILQGAQLRAGADVIPPTEFGWESFVSNAKTSEATFTELAEAALWWWNRKVPRTLKKAESELEGAAVTADEAQERAA